MTGTDMTRSDYPAYVFRKDGIEVRVRLYNGKSAQEIFFGIASTLTAEETSQITSANLNNLPSDTRAHQETFNPISEGDIARLAALGVKVSLTKATTSPAAAGSNRQAAVTSQSSLSTMYDRGPLGINGEEGIGPVLVITTAEFDKVLGGMNGF